MSVLAFLSRVQGVDVEEAVKEGVRLEARILCMQEAETIKSRWQRI